MKKNISISLLLLFGVFLDAGFSSQDIANSSFSGDVGLPNVYYYENSLKRPQINESNTLVSAEIYTTTASGIESQSGFDDKIIFFSNVNSDSVKNSPNLGHIFKNSTGYIDQEIYANKLYWGHSNIDTSENCNDLKKWCHDDLTIIYQLKKIETNKIVESLNYSWLFDINKNSELEYATDDDDNLSFELNDIFGSNFNDIMDIIDFKLIDSYFNRDDKNGKKFNNHEVFILFKKQNMTEFKSTDFIFKKNKGDVLNKPTFLNDKSLDDFNIEKFDVAQRMRLKNNTFVDQYKILFQTYSLEYNNRVHFLCPLIGWDDVFIPINIPSRNIGEHQIDPLFNYNGTKFSFLNYQDEQGGKVFDLYVVDISNKDCDDIRIKYNENSDEFRFDDIIKIDNNVTSRDEFDGDDALFNFTSYCWHPSKDILFYIKREFVNDNRTYPIYFYDFETKENKKINLPTKNHKYISISDDGRYLVYTFNGITEQARDSRDLSTANNQYFRFKNDYDNDPKLYNDLQDKVAIVELIYKIDEN